MDEKTAHFRTWKSGKSWLFATTLLTLTAGAGFSAINTATVKASGLIVTPTVITKSSQIAAAMPASLTTAPTTTSLSVFNAALSSVTTSSAIALPTVSAPTTSATPSATSTNSVNSNPASSTSSTTSVATASSAAAESSSSDLPTNTSAATDQTLLTATGAVLATASSVPLSTTSTAGTASLESATDSSSGPNTYTLENTKAIDLDAICSVAQLVGQSFDDIYKPGMTALTTGDIFKVTPTGDEFQIISAVDSDNPADGYPDNGLQAMAIAPIVNGVANLNSIIITYAGTNAYDTGLNPDDLIDWITNIETIIGGVNEFVPLLSDGVLPSQVTTAKQFADNVIAQYPTASYLFTGLSLGGYEAMAVAAEEQLPAFVFSGPDPSNILTANQIAYVQAHPNLYFNITNAWDYLEGAGSGNTLNDRVYYYNGNLSLSYLTDHMPTYTFNADGSISSPGSPIIGPIINTIGASIEALASPVVALATNVMEYIDTQIIPSSLGFIPDVVGAIAGTIFNVVNTVVEPFFNSSQNSSWLPLLFWVPFTIESTPTPISIP